MKYEVVYKVSIGHERVVTPEMVQELLDSDPGKCQFILLPDGGLRLRTFSTSADKYVYHQLDPMDFYARAIEE